MLIMTRGFRQISAFNYSASDYSTYNDRAYKE